MITAKKFYMIRHGQSEANAAKVFSGTVDVALTDLGRAQAQTSETAVQAEARTPARRPTRAPDCRRPC